MEGGRKTRTRTFADINDERVWARGHVDPFSRHILHLQAGVIRRLQQLIASPAARYSMQLPACRSRSTIS